ncbi:MAG TPA: hypothetical protein VFN20_06480 [Candidatus Acidoferrum sp.]|nr:hypothetical protein [Candidatus Acidoferrum sp.]
MNSPSRILSAILVCCCLSLMAHTGSAQSSNGLTLANNYFVTGDYVVGGVGLRGLGDATGFAKGKISIPDPAQPNAAAVPAGADVVAAFLYWETVESSNAGAATGENGFFNGYAITGTVRGNPNAPTSWSTGGCSGSAQGSKTMRVYRADVRPYLNMDASGKIIGNGNYLVQLADSGSGGGGVPLTLGASLIIIYRLQAPGVPLNSIVLYDGALAPNNSASMMTLPMVGFYQASASPIAKVTHIVGNGQPNKSETVLLNGVSLPSLYGNSVPPFPGVYNQNTFSLSGGGSWDNPTWLVNSFGNAVKANDSSATASVQPSSSNSGCVNWGAVVFSTTVQNSDGDGLLDVWKKSNGYTDVNNGQWVALPGAKSGQKDLFVELDYVSNLDGSAGSYLHSHLPKRAAIDKVGDAFKNRGIQVHFDLGAGIYQGDQYVISYPIAAPPAGSALYPNAGGNAISEGALVCTDGATLCAFPGESTVGWKGDVEFVQDQTSLGNFQIGRKDSYHYVLLGHALGSPRTYWPAAGTQISGSVAALVSIVVQNNVGTVTLTSPPYVTRPGDADCTELSCDRVVIEGALRAANAKLNGAFKFSSTPSSIPAGNTGPSTTTFTIQTSGVPNGTYNFAAEPQLALTYGGPTSDSGFSDIGGADSTVTFGKWSADDAAGCQPDPSKTLNANQAYCVNQVGTVTGQAGTILHELGHTFFLTHGGAYYPNGVVTSGALAGRQGNNPPAPATFGLNCNPAYISSMNYLFQIRGFPDGAGIDYSGQTMPSLLEGSLSETNGLGLDLYTGIAATHFTRWYAPPNALDLQLQSATGGHFASFHCDGSPITDGAQMVRVDGTVFPGASPSAKIDWNHNLVFDTASPQDVSFDGTVEQAGLAGFNDVVNLDLRQIGAREDAFGFSGGGTRVGGGGTRVGGGGTRVGGGGSRVGGGGTRVGGGGTEQDTDTANATADPPALNQPQMSAHNVLLTWNAPEFGQIRSYSIWRAEGSFTSIASVYANRAAFRNLTVPALTGAPPTTSFLDTMVQNRQTYTYFIVDTNKQGAQSAISTPVTITVRF